MKIKATAKGYVTLTPSKPKPVKKEGVKTNGN